MGTGWASSLGLRLSRGTDLGLGAPREHLKNVPIKHVIFYENTSTLPKCKGKAKRQGEVGVEGNAFLGLGRVN